VTHIIRHWKDHFKNDLRSDQDHRLRIDLRSDQDHMFKFFYLRFDHRSFFVPKCLSYKTLLFNFKVDFWVLACLKNQDNNPQYQLAG
jgi:hypothetical protein